MNRTEQEEIKLAKLKNDIELVEKRMNLIDAEQRMDSVNNKSELKKISFDLKHLRMQVAELQVQLKKKGLDEMNAIQEVLKQKCPEKEEWKSLTAKEVNQQVDCCLLDLENKSQTLGHSLMLKERMLREGEQTLKDMINRIREDSFPTEADCIQNLRDLDIEHMKVLKNISDCENSKIKFKSILQNLRKRECSCQQLVEDLIKKKNEEEVVKKETSTQRKIGNAESSGEKNEEGKIESMEKNIIAIKDATICYDIKEIDTRILEQKAIYQDLLELDKKSDKHLQELKAEKKNLTSKRNLMIEVDTIYPKRDIDLSLAKNRLSEQEMRLELAKAELDRLNSLSNRSKEIFLRLIAKAKPKVKQDELKKKNITELSKEFEKIVMRFSQPQIESSY